ncbi:MAG: glycosyltransferase family 4 protein, partial [Candidatus Aminicenantes bacterium]|nr:glycosyltransferase family 4 protein [Candidatus Aminicenantes bacterium]
IIFENDYPVLLSIGRFDSQKGHQYLIRSVELLLNRGVNVNLIIVGGGVLRDEIDNLIIRKGLGKFIKLYKNRESIKEFLLAADCFLLATLTEGASNVIMEAMASSLPVITTDIPSNRELVEDGVTGFLVPPQRPDLFADKIEQVLKDPEKMGIAGMRGREKMKKKFTIERMVGMYENLYEDA